MALKRTAPHSPHIADLSRVIQGRTKGIALPDEVAALTDLKGRYDAVRAQLNGVSNDAAKNKSRAAALAYQENPTAENLAAIGDVESRAEIEQKHSAMRTALKQKLKAIAEEVSPIARNIFERTAGIIAERMGELRAKEKEAAEKYGVPFSPSQTIAALENLAGQIDGTPFTLGAPFAFLSLIIKF